MRGMHRRFGGVTLIAALAVVGCGKDEGSTPPGGSSTAAATAAETAGTAAPHGSGHANAHTSASASSSAAPEKPDTSVADGEKAATDLHRHHRHHHHGGVAMFIEMAIDSLGVSADKKEKLDKIQAELHAKMKPSREAAHAVLQLIEEGVAAGKIDKAKVDAAIAKQEAASKEIHNANIEALNQLHALLSPAERVALVDKVKAHAEVWKKVNQDEEHGSKEKGSRLEKLKEDLGLSAEQVDKIAAALKKDAPPKPDGKEIDAHIKLFEEKFVEEKFDAKSLTTANAANAHISKFGAARMARFYEIVTPLLTPEQRTKLAEHLKERLNDKHAAK